MKIHLNQLLVICMSGIQLACSQSPVIVDTTNVEKTRNVTIQRNMGAGRSTITLKTTNLTSGSVSELEYPVYYEGAFDPVFENYYPKNVWLSKDVLWIGYKLDDQHSLVIRNLSGSLIPRIHIRTEDLLFLFDVGADSSVTVPVRWTANGRSEVEFMIAAALPNGLKVMNRRFAFPKTDKTKYQLTISETELALDIDE